MSNLWLTLLAFIVSVLLLYWLQRWITQHVQGVGLLLFNDFGAAMTVLWVVLLPGIVVHELSHWLMAQLLRLKTGKLRLWPQLKGKQIILGSVEVQKANVFKDSLVGLAPFLGGTLVILLIGYVAFDADTLGRAWLQGDWRLFLAILANMFSVPDSWLWLYLLIAVSNAMMPSPTDTVSWRPVLIYLVLVSAILLILGGMPSLSDTTVDWITGGFRTLAYAFGLAALIDLGFALVIWLAERGLSLVRGASVDYK